MNDLMSSIKNLREITGAGFLDCKKALEENSNDVEKSIIFLRKKGLAKASKKSSREAKEGAIGVFNSFDLTTIIQINTETDFAAKNEIFLNFMDLIGGYSLKIENTDITIEEFNNMSFDGTLISDYFKNIIAKIGENIVLSKIIVMQKHNDSLINNYIHNSYRKNIGKIAVALKYKVNNKNDESEILSKNLCMHIAASKPMALDIDQLDEDLIKKEKEVQIDTIKASGKPDNIIEKILDGKMNKFYSESTLLNQSYILEPDKDIKTVISDFSKINEFKILEYNLVVLEF